MTLANGTGTATLARTVSAPAPTHADPLDGRFVVDLPSERALRAYWDVDILNDEDEAEHRIIEANDPFTVVFRLQLKGSLWSCMNVDWWFDLGFAPIGYGKNFDLSAFVGKDKFWVKGWNGCKGTREITLRIPVQANTIPAEYCGTVYSVTGRVQGFCCGKPAGLSGFEPLGQYDFTVPEIED